MITVTITVDTMRSYRPCSSYPRERVLALWAGRAALTAQQIADLEIPAKDRIWALCQVLARLDRASLAAFAQGAEAAASWAAAAANAASAAILAAAYAAHAAGYSDKARAESLREAVSDLVARIEAAHGGAS